MSTMMMPSSSSTSVDDGATLARRVDAGRRRE
jgi:hypothetical protein